MYLHRTLHHNFKTSRAAYFQTKQERERKKFMELEIAIAIVGILIAIVGMISGVISIWLAIRYAKFNKKENSAGMTGEQVARKILDDNGLNHIKVSVVGSIMFGNSYSHYFKKVRLRRMTRHENSSPPWAWVPRRQPWQFSPRKKTPI